MYEVHVPYNGQTNELYWKDGTNIFYPIYEYYYCILNCQRYRNIYTL